MAESTWIPVYCIVAGLKQWHCHNRQKIGYRSYDKIYPFPYKQHTSMC